MIQACKNAKIPKNDYTDILASEHGLCSTGISIDQPLIGLLPFFSSLHLLASPLAAPFHLYYTLSLKLIMKLRSPDCQAMDTKALRAPVAKAAAGLWATTTPRHPDPAAGRQG